MMMLEEIRVLDLSHLLPGQYATSLLAQLGADVVTVEAPDGGHVSRWYPASFAMYNHSKRSVVLDLKDERGTEAFLSLAAEADVIVEQFRPGVVERLGVDYGEVSAINPEVVYCSVSGYGQSGPYADRVGHDRNYAARAGILDQTGQDDGPPTIPGVPMVDLGTGVFAALSVCAAIVGGGESTSTSQWPTSRSTRPATTSPSSSDGGAAPDRGEALLTGGYPCYAVYECANGEHLSVAAAEPHFWKRLCEDIGLREYAEDGFATGDRGEEVFDAVVTHFRERTRTEWLEVLDESRHPVAPVAGLGEVPADDHVRARELVRYIDDADRRVVAYPAQFENHAVSVRAPPALGEHTERILANAGYDEGTIRELAVEGVIGMEPDG